MFPAFSSNRRRSRGRQLLQRIDGARHLPAVGGVRRLGAVQVPDIGGIQSIRPVPIRAAAQHKLHIGLAGGQPHLTKQQAVTGSRLPLPLAQQRVGGVGSGAALQRGGKAPIRRRADDPFQLLPVLLAHQAHGDRPCRLYPSRYRKGGALLNHRAVLPIAVQLHIHFLFHSAANGLFAALQHDLIEGVFERVSDGPIQRGLVAQLGPYQAGRERRLYPA